MNMNWITIPETTEVSDWQTFYNNTTLLKQRFSYSTGANRLVTFSATSHDVSFRCYGAAGNDRFYDSAAQANFINSVGHLHEVKFAEAVFNGVEIYFFVDNEESPYYLINAFTTTESGQTIVVHAGINLSGNAVDVIQSSASNVSHNLLTMIDAHITENAYGSKVYVQPLCLYGEKTPFYTVIGGVNVLTPFSEFTVSGKTFMVIAKGLCVDISN